MKNNSKNRKLKYIRYKNALKRGRQVFCGYIKLSTTKDENILNIALEELQKSTIEALFKKYRIKLKNQTFDFGQDADDFIKNITTIRLTLCNRNL